MRRASSGRDGIIDAFDVDERDDAPAETPARHACAVRATGDECGGERVDGRDGDLEIVAHADV